MRTQASERLGQVLARSPNPSEGRPGPPAALDHMSRTGAVWPFCKVSSTKTGCKLSPARSGTSPISPHPLLRGLTRLFLSRVHGTLGAPARLPRKAQRAAFRPARRIHASTQAPRATPRVRCLVGGNLEWASRVAVSIDRRVCGRELGSIRRATRQSSTKRKSPLGQYLGRSGCILE
jgi:hypothetical protein